METGNVAVSLQRDVAAVKYWHHTIDLGHGIVTPGQGGDSSYGLERIALPQELSGKTVLDIGAWDGYYSFACEQRGAARVLATDQYIWHDAGWDGKAGFELARRALDSRVEDRDIDVFEIGPENVGMFDIVLFLGVLYHVRDPLGALEHAASVTSELLIVETHIDLLDVERPALAFYPNAEVCGDPTNWFGPNLPALIAMLQSLGFDTVTVADVQPLVADDEWIERAGDGSHAQGTRRGVVHARRDRPLR